MSGNTRQRGHPPKKVGETFGRYWSRISEQEVIAIALASKFIGVTPQSIFLGYLLVEDEQT